MLLIGTGSHAQRLVTLFDLKPQITAFASPTKAIWLNEPTLGDTPITHYTDDADAISATPGTHVAPRAVVLGSAKVGKACMIGAGAVVLEGAEVPDGTFVKALTIWKGERKAEAA